MKDDTEHSDNVLPYLVNGAKFRCSEPFLSISVGQRPERILDLSAVASSLSRFPSHTQIAETNTENAFAGLSSARCDVCQFDICVKIS